MAQGLGTEMSAAPFKSLALWAVTERAYVPVGTLSCLVVLLLPPKANLSVLIVQRLLCVSALLQNAMQQ